jgi:hypothetical protein
VTKTEIKKLAKGVILSRGPDLAMEFTTEMVARHLGIDADEVAELPDYAAIRTEIEYQAQRVYALFGV